MFQTVIEYQHEFDWADGGGGFAFACDQGGNVTPKNPDAAANYHACLTGIVRGSPVIDRGIVRREYEVRVCGCGSGDHPWVLTDARGIFIANVCGECVDGVKARYRPEIFADGCYECDEPIEEAD